LNLRWSELVVPWLTSLPRSAHPSKGCYPSDLIKAKQR